MGFPSGIGARGRRVGAGVRFGAEAGRVTQGDGRVDRIISWYRSESDAFRWRWCLGDGDSGGKSKKGLVTGWRGRRFPLTYPFCWKRREDRGVLGADGEKPVRGGLGRGVRRESGGRRCRPRASVRGTAERPSASGGRRRAPGCRPTCRTRPTSRRAAPARSS